MIEVNKRYRELFPNNCSVIETDGDGRRVGVCSYYLRGNNGKGCSRHGFASDTVEIGDRHNEKIPFNKIIEFLNEGMSKSSKREVN